MPFLSGISVLWLAAEGAAQPPPGYLSQEGAALFPVHTVAEATACARLARIDAVLVDCASGDTLANELLLARAAAPELRALPLIAVNVERSTQLRVGAAGFTKLVSAPSARVDVALALVSATQARPERADDAAFDLVPHLERHLAKGDLNGALALINATSVFRYTSIFRFDGAQLTSVWTHDRQAQQADAFPLTVTVDGSYCCYVRDTKAPFVVTNASTDPRVANHPKRLELQAYCGVPILREDNTTYGSLCHYDQAPRAADDATVGWLQTLAVRLPSLLTSVR